MGQPAPTLRQDAAPATRFTAAPATLHPNAMKSLLATALVAASAAAIAQPMPDMGLFRTAEVNWKDGPASLPAGARFAVLEGDPAKDGPFVMRFRLPDGFRIQPHWHPKTERITVISGTFHLGMGERFDTAKGHAMPAGTFGFWNEGMRHYAWTAGETVLQLHGIGPWSITYVDPADDPRAKK
jgi:anti-sigma factor ChrR (cupin superfamily)